MVKTVAKRWFRKFSDPDKAFVKNIKKHGFTSTFVFCEEAPSFCYSTGFWESLSHPEIVIFGLDKGIAHDLLWDAYSLVKKGQRFEHLSVSDQILKNCDCVFKAVTKTNIKEQFCFADWYYCRKPFEALQMFWPDKENLFPWDENVAVFCREDQPDLSLQQNGA